MAASCLPSQDWHDCSQTFQSSGLLLDCLAGCSTRSSSTIIDSSLIQTIWLVNLRSGFNFTFSLRSPEMGETQACNRISFMKRCLQSSVDVINVEQALFHSFIHWLMHWFMYRSLIEAKSKSIQLRPCRRNHQLYRLDLVCFHQLPIRIRSSV